MHSVNIGLDLQFGKNQGVLVGNKITGGIDYKDHKGEDQSAFAGDNAVSLGFDAQLMLGKSWSSMILVDPAPAYYPSGNDDRLQQDFIDLVAFAESKRLIVEIYKWLCHAAALRSQFKKQDAKSALKLRKTIVVAGQTGRITVALLNATTAATTFLFDDGNKLSTTLTGMRNTLIAGRELGKGDLTKQKADIRSIRFAVQSLDAQFRREQTSIQNEFINGDHTHDLSLKLDNTFVGILTGITSSRVKKAACQRLKTRLLTDMKTKSIPLFQDGGFNDAYLRSAMLPNTTPTAAEQKAVAQLIQLFKDVMPRFPLLEARMNLAADYARLVAHNHTYLNRLDTLIGKIDVKTIPQKQGRLTDITNDAYKRLTYVKIKTTTNQIDLSVGAKAVVPLLGQMLGVAAGGARVTVSLLNAINSNAKSSRYRLQNTAVSVPAAHGRNILVITQDTDLIYSQAVLSVEAGATATLLSESAGKTLRKEFGNQPAGYHNVLNAINYRSAVGYWQYPMPGTPVALGKGSGINLGYSIPTALLEKMDNKTFARKHPAVVETMAAYCGVPVALINGLIELSNIGTLRQRDPTKADQLPSSLIIETGFAFPDAFLRDPNKNSFRLTVAGENKPDSPYHYCIENILDQASTRAFIKEIQNSRQGATPIMPDWIRIRYQVAEGVDNSDRKFTLGVLVKVPFVLDLKPIEKAGTETLMDLYTLFPKEQTYNLRGSRKKGHSRSIPPVILLTQS